MSRLGDLNRSVMKDDSLCDHVRKYVDKKRVRVITMRRPSHLLDRAGRMEMYFVWSRQANLYKKARGEIKPPIPPAYSSGRTIGRGRQSRPIPLGRWHHVMDRGNQARRYKTSQAAPSEYRLILSPSIFSSRCPIILVRYCLVRERARCHL